MKTNREHFSWSQYNLWQNSKRSYWKTYNQSVPSISNRFYDKGRELSALLETGELPGRSGDPMLELVSKEVPRLGIMEQELRFELDIKKGERKEVLCYVDSGADKCDSFIEYKTGKLEWTQERVDEHEQLPFYALGYFEMFGIIPASQLVWIETMETEQDGLLYTGRVETFNRTFTKKDIDAMRKKVVATIKEIDEYLYMEYEVAVDDANRYAYLLGIIKDAELELSDIKMKVESELIGVGADFGKADAGNFMFQERKTWDYSPAVDEIKKQVAKQQRLEQKEEIATYTTKKSIMFKLNKNE